VHAVIMAGGRGSRLAPYTTVLPKPLMPLDDRPILAVVLEQLVNSGVTGITISVGHLSGLIESWISHQSHVDVPIGFVYEDEPLGTAGALANVDLPGGTFLAMNGDVLATLDYAQLAAHHERSGALATMATNVRHVDVQYGVVHTDEQGHIARLEEKPRLSYTVSMGVYAMSPELVELIGPGEHIDFPDLLLRAMDAGHPIATYPFDGYWRDIGNAQDYEQAIADFAADPQRFLHPTGGR
jgi:NDP-sugar pyrophosphorylase family protein